MLRELGITGCTALGFYALCHTFASAAEESRNTPPVMQVMGHADAGMTLG